MKKTKISKFSILQICAAIPMVASVIYLLSCGSAWLRIYRNNTRGVIDGEQVSLEYFNYMPFAIILLLIAITVYVIATIYKGKEWKKNNRK